MTEEGFDGGIECGKLRKGKDINRRSLQWGVVNNNNIYYGVESPHMGGEMVCRGKPPLLSPVRALCEPITR